MGPSPSGCPPRDLHVQAGTDNIDQSNTVGNKSRTTAVLVVSLSALTIGLGVAELSRRKRESELYLLGRDIISAQMDNILGSPDILQMAARQTDLSSGNFELAACLIGPGLCTATDPNHQVPFGLRQGMDEASPVVISTEGHSAYFGKKGEINCDTRNVEECPGWTVQAWFWAECEDNKPTCNLAKTIHVRHQVLPLAALDHLPAEPKTMDLASDPYAFDITVKVRRL
jgi:hypothetical protein